MAKLTNTNPSLLYILIAAGAITGTVLMLDAVRIVVEPIASRLYNNDNKLVSVLILVVAAGILTYATVVSQLFVQRYTEKALFGPFPPEDDSGSNDEYKTEDTNAVGNIVVPAAGC